MKKLNVLILIFTFAGPILAFKDSTVVLKMKESRFDGVSHDSTTFLYTYYPNGIIKKRERVLSSQLSDITLFDQAGRIVLNYSDGLSFNYDSTIYSWIGADSVIMNYNFLPDDGGRYTETAKYFGIKPSTLYSRIDADSVYVYDSTGTKRYSIHFTHDSRGNVLESNFRIPPSDTLAPFITSTFEYDDSGLIIKENRITRHGADQIFPDEITYTYEFGTILPVVKLDRKPNRFFNDPNRLYRIDGKRAPGNSSKNPQVLVVY